MSGGSTSVWIMKNNTEKTRQREREEEQSHITNLKRYMPRYTEAHTSLLYPQGNSPARKYNQRNCQTSSWVLIFQKPLINTWPRPPTVLFYYAPKIRFMDKILDSKIISTQQQAGWDFACFLTLISAPLLAHSIFHCRTLTAKNRLGFLMVLGLKWWRENSNSGKFSRSTQNYYCSYG